MNPENKRIIRDAIIDDASQLQKIYAYYTLHTAISFEYAAPSVEEFAGRMRRIMSRYPYLVAIEDGIIQGYAYAGPFVGRKAYDWSAEVTIYLNPNRRKCGLGRALYEELESKLCKMGILNLYACIGYTDVEDEYLTNNSAEFHAHMGYKQVGRFHKCGYKFNRWYDMIWMEKIIGRYADKQTAVMNYSEICEKSEMQG